MHVEQAIFASSARGPVKGYQLVAASEGINRELAREIHRWSPTQLVSDDPHQWTVNYFPLDTQWVAVGRTVLGGPEYSNRGGLEVVTRIAVLSNQQFFQYDYDASAVCSTALALGALRLPSELPNRVLPLVQLPDKPFVSAAVGRDSITPNSDSDHFGEHDFDSAWISQAVSLLRHHKPVAIIGACNPRDAAAKLIASMSPPDRPGVSFTTGLPPAMDRPFQLHFLPELTHAFSRALEQADVHVLNLADILQPTA